MKDQLNTLSRSLLFTAAWLLAAGNVLGQFSHHIVPERIAVMCRPSPDSIVLRWAPLSFRVWQAGNAYGYRIERYVLARRGALLARPEKTILATTIKPLAEDKWNIIVLRNKYAAIAGQALFGERFEIDLRQSDVFSIVDKVRENEQRHAFALFSADMSPEVARASGLWFADTEVKPEEKYLYRVVINSMDSLRGSAFLSPGDPYTLPTPQNLKADFKEHFVSLKWDKSRMNSYTAYIVERSEDGVHFHSISDIPLVTASPAEGEDSGYEYAMDSLQDLSATYHYRVKGITPFGEESRPSGAITGKGFRGVSQVPYIASVENSDNTRLVISWNFPDSDNSALRGFLIERATAPKGEFSVLTEKLLAPSARMFQDDSPERVNYYRVTARALNGDPYESPLYFAQLIDSIPPAPPSDLGARISGEGLVLLTWKPNKESDIYGYRVYKAYHQGEELAQITSMPVIGTTFTDQVDLNTLNEQVYYRVMALDISQNHSGLSEILKVPLPDKVKPQAPVLLPGTSKGGSYVVRWNAAPSGDVAEYRLYRRAPRASEWEHLKSIKASADTNHYFEDATGEAGEIYYYTVIAVDDAGLESEPAHPLTGGHFSKQLRPAITWKRPRIDREQNRITLAWEYDQPKIAAYRIYRAVNEHPPILLKTLIGEAHQFTDSMIPGARYKYRILAFFSDGNKSFLSEEIDFQY